MELHATLRQVPFVRICFFFITGISLANCFKTGNHFILYSLPVVLTFLVGLLLNRSAIFLKRNYQSLLIYIAIMYYAIYAYGECFRHTLLPSFSCQYAGIVAGPAMVKEKSIQVDIRLYRADSILNKRLIKDKIRLYLAIDSPGKVPEMGDSISFACSLRPIRNNGNPKEFDYARYLSLQQIFYQGYCKKGDYILGGHSGKFRIRRIALRIQQLSVRKLKESGLQGNELGVLSALATGYRELLGNDILSDYAASGAMHVLSVSGLHVGILFMFLNLLFGKRNNKLSYRLVRMVIILLIIWFYAFITGLSSPVIRASIMFSFFLIGKNFNRYVNSVNILAVSAFLVLLINPQELFNVGFQFSYLAVTGILFFQPTIQNLIIFKNGLLDRTWQLIAVSIAAQITTFPLALYYFHQFPVYFLLTNLVVIPFTWLIMMLTLAFYIFLPLTFLSMWIAWLLGILLKIMNYSIGMIADLPFAVIKDVRFEMAHVIVWCIIIVLVSVYIFYYRRKWLLLITGTLIILLLLFDIDNFCFDARQKTIVVYNMRGNIAFSLISGHNHMFLTEGFTEANWTQHAKYLRPYWISRKICKNITWIPFENLNNQKSMHAGDMIVEHNEFGYSLLFYDVNILYLNPLKGHKIDFKCIPHGGIDVIFINKESGYPCPEYGTFQLSGKVLVGQDLGLLQKQLWHAFAEKSGAEFYDITEQGAYIRDIDKKSVP